VSAPTIELRTALLNAIVAKRDGAGYVALNEFDAIESQLPSVSLPELRERARVTVVGMAGDQERLSRGGFYEISQPVHVLLQRSVKPTDKAGIDALIQLLDELKKTARDLAGYRWQRVEALKDTNGTPYDYVRLHDDHVFESVFIARYTWTAAEEDFE